MLNFVSNTHMLYSIIKHSTQQWQRLSRATKEGQKHSNKLYKGRHCTTASSLGSVRPAW